MIIIKALKISKIYIDITQEDEIFAKVKKYVIEDRFCKQINSQVCQAVVSEIKFQLGVVNLSNSNEAKVKENLETAFRNISFDDIKNKTCYFSTLKGSSIQTIYNILHD